MERAFLENMGDSELNLIANACKKARFDTLILDESNLRPTLEILASQLKSIDFGFSCSDLGNLANAWSGCMNLKAIMLGHCDL